MSTYISPPPLLLPRGQASDEDERAIQDGVPGGSQPTGILHAGAATVSAPTSRPPKRKPSTLNRAQRRARGIRAPKRVLERMGY